MKTPKEPGNIKLTEDQVKDLQERLRQNKLSDEERELLSKVLQGFVWLNKMLEAKKLSMRKLSKLFGFKTEKSQESPQNNQTPKKSKEGSSGSDKRNGKNGHDKYSGAQRVVHEHEELAKGDRCPACRKGNLYEVDPGIFVHVKGAPPLMAIVHEAQKLRCATCGAIFTATVPKEARIQKYDETADALIALMKYGAGTPFYRLGKLQRSLGVPLPASTQWERVEELTNSIYPVYQMMVRLAAQGEVIHTDDTKARVLNLARELKINGSERKGLFTTGIVSKAAGRTYNLFFTGNRHAGENMDELLKQRSSELGPVIQMSDGLALNRPKNAVTTLCGCLTHARRGFFDALPDRKKECDYVLHILRKVYKNDSVTRDRNMNDMERMKYHQKKSGPLMRKLRRWGLKCFYLKKVEPSESLGEALRYLFNHWEKLTQFLRVPGAPLENNIVERLLKTAILHRKNALFYKTWMGALVGDVMMSLIQTCISAGKNPFDYLVALHRNWKKVKAWPSNFMPWNYEENLLSSNPI
jgi:transposase